MGKRLDPRFLAERDISRFWSKVARDPTSGCWEWQAYRNPAGYGVFSMRRKTLLAHRWAYEHFIGPIPEGLDLDHLCRNRCCCNPNHVEPVTRKTNVLRGDLDAMWRGYPSRNAAKTHCPAGHAYDERNTYVDKIGRRFCRACRCARESARYRRLKAS